MDFLSYRESFEVFEEVDYGKTRRGEAESGRERGRYGKQNKDTKREKLYWEWLNSLSHSVPLQYIEMFSRK